MEEYGRDREDTDGNIIWRMRSDAGYLTLHTHSEYDILIASPWQQWLRQSTSVLRYTYIVLLLSVKDTTYALCQE